MFGKSKIEELILPASNTNFKQKIMGKKTAVVGAGISGLSSVYKLVEAGHQVTVFAKQFSPNVTSNKAAAFWFPFHVRNDKRGIVWSNDSYQFYKTLSQDPASGISIKKLVKMIRAEVTPEEPVWLNYIPKGAWRIMQIEELKPGYGVGYEIDVPLIETQIFLPYLQNILEGKGVIFMEKEVQKLEELSNDFDVVINCSGLGSRELCHDEDLVPVRGQVALLAPKADFKLYIDNENALYVVPRKDAIIVGGTYEQQVFEAATEPKAIENILQKAFDVFPELKQQAVIGNWAGLRPFRENVRLELEEGTNIIHNYGHGGSGFTLSFGCAESVKDLVDKI